jgi:protein tyrosine/serine phosphatase
MGSLRILPLANVHNFRDYGGYGVAGGGRLRQGLLFRSGQHLEATEGDLDAIAALDLATVVDLRGDTERRLYPCRRPAGFAAEVVFAPGETTGSGNAPHLEAAAAVVTAVDARRRMVESYKQMPFREPLVASFRRYFASLAERPGTSLVHCLAGKDRTGLAVALLHAVLGVHPDDIMSDYMLTNIAGNINRRIEAGARIVRANMGAALDDDAVRTVMSVDEAYLDSAFAAIRERYTSIDAYTDTVCGVTPVVRAKLVAQLVGHQ